MKRVLLIAGIIVLAAAAFVLGGQWGDMPFNVPGGIIIEADTARVYALACVYVGRTGEAHPVYEDPDLEIHKWLNEQNFEFILFKPGPQMDHDDDPFTCTTRGYTGRMNFGELIYWR